MVSATILVTGSSSGLGRCMVEVLARAGHTVYASMRATEGKNAGVAEELRTVARAERLALHVIDLDVTDDASVQGGIDTIVSQSGQIDVVINNAGYGLGGITEAIAIPQAQRLFDVNVFGALRVTQAALPHMRRRRSGLVVFISSNSAHWIIPTMGIYSASKAALELMARGFSYELPAVGVDTTIVQTGGFATDFGHNLEQASNREVWDAYGQLGQFAHAFADGMGQTMKSGSNDLTSDPHTMAELLVKLIAIPQGSRPTKVQVGTLTNGLAEINQLIEQHEHATLQAIGIGHLVAGRLAGAELAPEVEAR
jgi:NAD(P)-dependent dehydrogenase (short-subunit alcohol dehydrogenase family)